MIISVGEFKALFPHYTDISDNMLELKLNAVENLIRTYTNNNFQWRNCRFSVSSDTALLDVKEYFNVGDTVQITESENNDGIYVIKNIENRRMVLNKNLLPSENNLVTLIKYPPDIIAGAINMLKWDFENRDKVGIQSETISRHSVTYFNMDGDNSVMGYPKSLLGFLKPYIKARF